MLKNVENAKCVCCMSALQQKTSFCLSHCGLISTKEVLPWCSFANSSPNSKD